MKKYALSVGETCIYTVPGIHRFQEAVKGSGAGVAAPFFEKQTDNCASAKQCLPHIKWMFMDLWWFSTITLTGFQHLGLYPGLRVHYWLLSSLKESLYKLLDNSPFFSCSCKQEWVITCFPVPEVGQVVKGVFIKQLLSFFIYKLLFVIAAHV